MTAHVPSEWERIKKQASDFWWQSCDHCGAERVKSGDWIGPWMAMEHPAPYCEG